MELTWGRHGDGSSLNEDTAVGKACGFFYTAYCNIITVYLKMTQKSAEISIMIPERRILAGMNFRLIIDKEKEEEVVATVQSGPVLLMR